MPEQQYDTAKVTQYREAAIELHELRLSTEQRIQAALESGDKQVARDALAELKASGEKFEKFRSTLTPGELFVAKYSIEVHGDHEVSFVLPKGASRYEMLREAQGLVKERNLVFPEHLAQWQTDPAFEKRCEIPERIRINARVEGGDGTDRATQESLVVESLKLTLPSLKDLAAAFVAHYVATGQPLFGWHIKDLVLSFTVRAADGALSFCRVGLYMVEISDDRRGRDVAVAALDPSTSPRLRRTSRN